MKKNISLLSLLIFIFSFILTRNPFNYVSAFRITAYTRAYDNNGHLRTRLNIPESEELASIDSYEFHSTMEELAKNNHLVVYGLESDENTSTITYRMYLSDNDIYINEWLLVDGSAKINLNDNVYSMKSDNKKYKISNILYPSFNLSVSNLKNKTKNSGVYFLFNLEGDIEENVTNFIEGLQKEYGDFPYKGNGSKTYYDYTSDLEYSGGLTNDLKLKVAIVLILTLMLCSKIFSMTREISVHKIEGQNAFSIYWDMFLKYLIKYSLIDLLLFFICLFIYFFGGINSFRVFSDLFLLEYVQVFGIEIVISLVIYLVIRFVPIVSSFKGESKMTFVEQIAYITKMGAVFILLPSVLTCFTQTKDLITMVSRHEHVLNILENYYQFGGDLASRYSLDIGQDSYLAVREQFVKETGGFVFSKGYWSETLQTPDADNLKWFYKISWSYIRNNHLLDNDDWVNDAVVFMTPGVTYTESEIEWNIFTSLGSEKDVHFIYIDYYPDTFSFNELLKQDKVSSYPLVYTPDLYGYEGQMTGSIFYYEGSLEEATELANKAFRDNGYAPAYTIESMQNNFEQHYEVNAENLIKQVCLFLAILFAIALTNRFLIQSDIDSNSQRYRVAFTEGVQPYGILTYILKIASPAFLALIACVISKRITGLNNIFYNFIFIIIFESILYIYYLHYYRKVVHK